ncbi:hypothetical protein E2C01_102139 [Portunus trituberculatus]|uniref:Uncharacterized protein n=1 Tax=Portunus trituberculatus TaxID=210409 RepID=A0A5B7KCD4_PORTR|nr:hypothetical protein [Portunus trituberculatus]
MQMCRGGGLRRSHRRGGRCRAYINTRGYADDMGFPRVFLGYEVSRVPQQHLSSICKSSLYHL